mmetsp:Transcript_6810/g.12255  ORF Transcript_6810/g.12255 Transcript_6810/m.12255 type:complete len:187 (-) Transcript_6810:165-725(-)
MLLTFNPLYQAAQGSIYILSRTTIISILRCMKFNEWMQLAKWLRHVTRSTADWTIMEPAIMVMIARMKDPPGTSSICILVSSVSLLSASRATWLLVFHAMVAGMTPNKVETPKLPPRSSAVKNTSEIVFANIKGGTRVNANTDHLLVRASLSGPGRTFVSIGVWESSTWLALVSVAPVSRKKSVSP